MTGLFQKPVGQLPVDALFNATIQMLPFPIQADHQRGKRPFGKAVLGLERGHRDAGEMMDLQGSDDFRGITRVQSCRGERISRCQTRIQMIVSLFAGFLAELRPNSRIARWRFAQTL